MAVRRSAAIKPAAHQMHIPYLTSPAVRATAGDSTVPAKQPAKRKGMKLWELIVPILLLLGAFGRTAGDGAMPSGALGLIVILLVVLVVLGRI